MKSDKDETFSRESGSLQAKTCPCKDVDKAAAVVMNAVSDYPRYVPHAVAGLENPQTDIPRIAKDRRLLKQIEAAVRQIPTTHRVIQGDARELTFLEDELIHLVVTSPPYWTLKKYRNHVDQLGNIENYETFLRELDKVWAHCHRVLVPGGRLICVVGDVCLSRRKNDVEFILMQRKPGGYRKPALAKRVLSVISDEHHKTIVSAHLVRYHRRINPTAPRTVPRRTRRTLGSDVFLRRGHGVGSFHGNGDVWIHISSATLGG